MADYDAFAEYYDQIIGEPTQTILLLQKWIKKYAPSAQSILELGCGTGAVLKPFSGKYEIYGLDLSSAMLSKAKKKIKGGQFYQQNMAHFNLNKKFDVILCIFDSMNHLLTFQSWEKVFANVSNHLSKRGVFIFDVNTALKLKKFSTFPADVNDLGNILTISKVSKIKNNLYAWPFKIFVKEKNNTWKLIEENSRERAFPTAKIKSSLQKRFKIMAVIDSDQKRPSQNSERLYFICKHK